LRFSSRVSLAAEPILPFFRQFLAMGLGATQFLVGAEE
jgi:hypothetical protein